jgi:carboxyl-terminal processing protease
MGGVGRWALLVGLAGAAVLTVLGVRHAVREGWTSWEDDASLAQLNGVWRSRGYGWLWEIDGRRVRAFDESGLYCVARPDLRRQLLDEEVALSADKRSLKVSLFDPAYRFTFDRIETLPAACTRTPDASPLAVVDALGQIFSAHYAFFKTRSVDWPGLLAAARRNIRPGISEADLLAELGALLAHIDDDHVTLSARIAGEGYECNPGEARLLRPADAAAWEKEGRSEHRVGDLQAGVWARQDTDRLLGDTGHTTANGNIKYGLIGGDVGYLSLLSMEDFDASDDDDEPALQEALDDALTLFQGARAVIVDVSLNDGGEDRLARVAAARFAAKPTRIYSKYAGDVPPADVRGGAPQAIDLEPSKRPRFTGPVYLMTSNITVSAAEIFTMAMRALPNVTHVGQTTRGALSDVLTMQLPNGWLVTLSNEVYLDAAGKAWEGRGIPPALAIPVFENGSDPAVSHALALRAVLARID